MKEFKRRKFRKINVDQILYHCRNEKKKRQKIGKILNQAGKKLTQTQTTQNCLYKRKNKGEKRKNTEKN